MGDYKFYEAIATLVGGIIGAGILGIPYVIAKAGFWTGIFDIVFIGIILLILHLYVGEISLRTNGRHELTGYASKYLGKYGKLIMTLAMILGIYGALSAYTIGEGLALQAIFGGSALLYSIIFFGLISILVYMDLRAVEKSEIFFDFFIILLILSICVISFFNIKSINFTAFDVSKLLVPYGVILFAFIGTTAIPEIKEILIKDRKKLKKAIVIGTCIPLAIYLLFAIAVVGVTGITTTEIGTLGLGEVIGQYMIILSNFFAVFAMGSSFLVLSLGLKWVFQYDYKISKGYSFWMVCLIPFLIGISGMADFIKIISFTGAITFGIEGTLIVIMFHRAKKMGDRKPEYNIKGHLILSLLLISMFLFGIVYQFIK
ncbi:MAG: aromatic amino acid transport family protein [Candidatus Woesearchaeota archaeon]